MSQDALFAAMPALEGAVELLSEADSREDIERAIEELGAIRDELR